MIKHLAAGLALLAAACSGHPAPGTVSGDDAVNTGYGTQDRRTVAGAVNSITTEDFDRFRNSSLEDLLRTRIPGVQIVNSRFGFAIRLRGMTSISGSNDALIVLDGMPIEGPSASIALGSLRASEVARIDVLKDATAAIYGIRGANGVVVITTRR